jgi:anti-anti-sigma factor
VQYLTVSTRERDGVLLIHVTGELFLPDVPPLMRQVTASLTSKGHPCVVCDLEGLATPMSPWLLSVFPAALRRAGGWPSCSLRLATLSPAVLRCVERLRMHRYLPVHRTLEEAIRQGRLDVGPPPHAFTLPPDPAQLTHLRATVRELWPHPVAHGRDETELVADELAANAIRHVGAPFTVALAFRPAQTLVAVTDRSRSEPSISRRPGQQAVSGRGIQIVTGLSKDWGVRLVHAHGKTVWAVLPASPSAVTARIPRNRQAID